MIRRYPFLLLALIGSLLATPLSAKYYTYERPPKALLVVLQTRQGQVDYMHRHYPPGEEELQQDIQGVIQATLFDFSTNFDFCPVYFFVDTNADRIMEGKFAGVLLDGKMQPVDRPVLNDGDTAFFIATYGMIPQPQEVKTTALTGDETNAYQGAFGDDPTALMSTLLVMDHHFSLLKLPRPRTIRGYTSRARYRRSKLSYRSKHYNIDYIPMAASYSDTIDRYFTRLRRMHAREAF